jgi:hypothetical protein
MVHQIGQSYLSSMLPRTIVVRGALAALLPLGCGESHNGFAPEGLGRIQGFVSRADGTPVADVPVGASFGPDAFGPRNEARTDARGLYELEAVSYQSLDDPPFTADSVIPCRLIVGTGLADTIVPVRFAPINRSPVPVTVNFVVDPP